MFDIDVYNLRPSSTLIFLSHTEDLELLEEDTLIEIDDEPRRDIKDLIHVLQLCKCRVLSLRTIHDSLGCDSLAGNAVVPRFSMSLV